MPVVLRQSGGIAQLVEQGNHNPRVVGSSPSSATPTEETLQRFADGALLISADRYSSISFNNPPKIGAEGISIRR